MLGVRGRRSDDFNMPNLVYRNLTSDKKYNSKFFEIILVGAIKELKLADKKVGLSVNLVGEGKIRELNTKYRNKNKATDFLSFPMASKLEIGPACRSGRNWKLEIPKSNTEVLDLGDIFICLSFAKNEAKSENISIERKLAQLVVHGFLHLLGYDHEKSEKDAKKMFGLENKILN